ncbi:MAG TPA: alpha/beta hydrolase, partial [Streptosporangiaceae bacterium]|nr:alpha/beta hydrolase [Streptosporangiaceae bacterium]
MVTETDLDLADGRTLHFYDTSPGDAGRLAVFWHHGTPNTGAPPEPLFAAAAEAGLRWVSYDRPAYGGSTPNPGRDIGSAAAEVAAIADALGLDRFAVMGHSGGGSRALACGALLSGRVTAVVCASGMAPFGAAGLDWFAGMYPGGAAGLRAAAAELRKAGAEGDADTGAAGRLAERYENLADFREVAEIEREHLRDVHQRVESASITYVPYLSRDVYDF